MGVILLLIIAGLVWLIIAATREWRKQRRMTPEALAAYRQAALDRYEASKARRTPKITLDRGRTSVTKSRRHTSHVFHLLATCLTAGLWLPVWAWQTCWHIIGPRRRTVTRHQ